MSWFDQGPYQVRLEWGMSGATQLQGTTYAVVVDTLSFSTTVTKALDSQLVVLPFPHHAEGGEEFAAAHQARLVREREQAAQEGAPSLSPASLDGLEPGTRLVIPSENGSRICYELREKGATVLAGGLRNRSVLAARLVERLQADPEATVLIVCAGEQWPDGTLRPCFEDQLGAGAIVAALENAGIQKCSPEAYAAAAVFRDAAPFLPQVLHDCSSGRELGERGYSRDVEIAAELDVSQHVPVLRGDEFQSARDA